MADELKIFDQLKNLAFLFSKADMKAEMLKTADIMEIIDARERAGLEPVTQQMAEDIEKLLAKLSDQGV